MVDTAQKLLSGPTLILTSWAGHWLARSPHSSSYTHCSSFRSLFHSFIPELPRGQEGPVRFSGGAAKPYLENQGDLVSRLITPIPHIVALVIPIINLLTKSPDPKP